MEAFQIMKEDLPVVSVAMSTYNGEKYISEQIDSILRQQGVTVNLVIRDDGSDDSTVQIIEGYLNRGNVKLIQGDNIGYGKSFMKALFACPVSDYYAFSDQDDVWFPDKLIKTIRNMGCSDSPKLGFCSAYFTDADLNIMNGINLPDSEFVSNEMGFVRCLASGYRLVINASFFRLIEKAGPDIPTTHDIWIGGVAGYLAKSYYLNEKLVYHRRLNNSVSRRTLYKLLKSRVKALLFDQGVNIACAKLMLGTYLDYLSPADIDYFSTVANYRNAWRDKAKLLKNKKIIYPRQYGRLTPKIKILLNRF